MIKQRILLLLASFLIVSLAQPDWSVICCILASAVGYALFWKAVVSCATKKGRFVLGFLWFGGVQLIHLSWFTADHYVGGFIYVFLALVFISLGSLFGLLTLFIKKPQRISMSRILAVAGGWTLIEWSRLFFLSGFSWNPVGLALSGTLYGMQMASIVGVFGLTFWVILTNLMGFRLFSRPFDWGRLLLFLGIAATPYLFGYAEVTFHEKMSEEQSPPPLSVVLVQTALTPEQKTHFGGSIEPLSPLAQWQRMLTFLKQHDGKDIDLIVFSETVVPYGTDMPVFTLQSISDSFEEAFSVRLRSPDMDIMVGNSYWAQTLANYFEADVAIGLEDADENGVYNAGFLFSPFSKIRQRYEKRVLVPLGEYIPFNWCRSFLIRYGITDSFQAGSEAKVFTGKRGTVGMSICYEEAFGHLMRETRLKGADLLVNMTNDVWYPQSRLPMVHFLHGRLRAVEGGIPIARASNTGLTCGVDSLGRLVGAIECEGPGCQAAADALHLHLSSYTYPTLYTYLGDGLIVVLSLCLVIFDCLVAVFATKGFILNRLAIWRLRKNRE